MTTYYKLARPDGWDFHTGHTINYREAIGRIVKPPNANPRAELCSPGILHASLRAEDCFQGASIPCSLYEIEGTPVCADSTKAGFVEMRVLRELDPASHFKWRYTEAIAPLNPFLLPMRLDPSAHDLELLHQWASVRDSVRDSVWAYIGWIFAPIITEWKGIEHHKDQYPFMPAVHLWRRGLVPSFDKNQWRLHSGNQATIVWSGKL